MPRSAAMRWMRTPSGPSSCSRRSAASRIANFAACGVRRCRVAIDIPPLLTLLRVPKVRELSMDDWHPGALATIADRLGIAVTDLAPPCSQSFRAPGGPNIHVLDWGGHGPPAVLLHGGSLTSHTWDYVAIALRADFRLVALDMRGHGASDWTD